jgi:hypothetical protein
LLPMKTKSKPRRPANVATDVKSPKAINSSKNRATKVPAAALKQSSKSFSNISQSSKRKFMGTRKSVSSQSISVKTKPETSLKQVSKTKPQFKCKTFHASNLLKQVYKMAIFVQIRNGT